MDQANKRDLIAMDAKPEQVLMMRDFESNSHTLDVPDPYYGSGDGFEDAYQMLKLNANGLLDYLLQHKDI
jgi:protein-tyrosine phosphatase